LSALRQRDIPLLRVLLQHNNRESLTQLVDGGNLLHHAVISQQVVGCISSACSISAPLSTYTANHNQQQYHHHHHQQLLPSTAKPTTTTTK
jgi:hypothetical protein